MKKDMIPLSIKFYGESFSETNRILEHEEEIMKSVLILYSKEADIYTEAFKCNPNIVLESREVFGNIIIDDNHVVIVWETPYGKIEFYYEQYWAIKGLSIEKDNAEKILVEILRAFEKQYGKKFRHETETLHYEAESSSEFLRLSIFDEQE